MKKYIWERRGKIRVRRDDTEKKGRKEGSEQTIGRNGARITRLTPKCTPSSVSAWLWGPKQRAATFLPTFCGCYLINKHTDYAKVKHWITDFHLLCNRISLVKPVLSPAAQMVDLFSQPLTLITALCCQLLLLWLPIAFPLWRYGTIYSSISNRKWSLMKYYEFCGCSVWWLTWRHICTSALLVSIVHFHFQWRVVLLAFSTSLFFMCI